MKDLNYSDEYLGRFGRVCKSSDIFRMGSFGIIVKETKNMLYLQNDKIIKIPKKGNYFYIEGLGIIEGDLILYKGSDRIRLLK